MFKDKIKEFFRKEEGDNKKQIENLVVFVIILIVTILIINMVWKDDNKSKLTNDTYTKLAEKTNTSSNKDETSEYNLEKNLEDILGKISGAGKVKVLITYTESTQVVPLSNENYKETQTEESDKAGGNRKINEIDKSTEIIYQEANGKKEIITQKLVMPKIEGALILSTGANSSNVKNNIIQAVEALTGLANHKIQVLQMED